MEWEPVVWCEDEKAKEDSIEVLGRIAELMKKYSYLAYLDIPLVNSSSTYCRDTGIHRYDCIKPTDAGCVDYRFDNDLPMNKL